MVPGIRPGVSDEREVMSQVKAASEPRFTRMALGITLTVGLLATAAAALPVGRTVSPDPAPTPVIAPVDSVGINVLEPAGQTTRSTAPAAPTAPAGNLERQVQNWVPTGNGGNGGGMNGNHGGNGGGNGVHGSPKG
jgi:hypothetical protein